MDYLTRTFTKALESSERKWPSSDGDVLWLLNKTVSYYSNETKSSMYVLTINGTHRNCALVLNIGLV